MARVDSNAASLEIRLFGKPSVFLCGKDITSEFSKRALWMIAMLAVHEAKSLDRAYLAGSLWPDSSDSAALYNLRQTLAAARRALGDAKEVIGGSSRTVELHISPDVIIDVVSFDEACKDGGVAALDKAFGTYGGELLPGCEEPFAVVARERREHEFLSAADKLADHYVANKTPQSAIPILRRILFDDPYRESACRSLMSALADAGEWASALESYREFRRRLRQELNTDVSAETKALYRTIRTYSQTGVPKKESRQSIPIPLTELIGRSTEISTVVSLLERCRLVTLCGPGGVGKTRLSIAVAQAMASKYLDGAYFVDLAPTQSDQTIEGAIAAALDVKESVQLSRLQQIADHLSEREVLIVLDNCEHLTDEVSRLSEHLLTLGSGLHILATSRQTLGVRGEFVWQVPVLSLPKATDKPAEIVESEAVQLFMGRYRRPKEQLRDKEIESIGSICRRLDGLPLAIELAAARTNVLSAADIEKRLDNKFALLTGGTQSLQRHQTLRACMEWSWDLLADEEQSLMMCLSTFRGGCTLGAIEFIAATGEAGVVDLLASLIDRSLVKADVDGESARYMLLETVREFSEERLKSEGAWEDAHDRHRDFYQSWVEETYHPMSSVEEAKKFAAFETDHDNLRSAIAWCYARNHGAKAVSMCAALSRFWDTHGHVNEGRDQIERAIRTEAPGLSLEIRGRALVHAGWLAAVQRDNEAAIRYYEQARDIARHRNDQHALGVITTCLASTCIVLKDFAMAEKLLMESLEIRRAGNRSVAPAYANLSDVALEQGEYDRARLFIQESLREMGGPSVERAGTSGCVLRNLAFVDWKEGKCEEALSHAIQAVRIFNEGAILYEVPFALMVVAFAESGLGRWERAVRLLAACEAFAIAQGTPPVDFLARAKAEVETAALKFLKQRDYSIAVDAGRLMPLGTAMEFAFIQESSPSERLVML